MITYSPSNKIKGSNRNNKNFISTPFRKRIKFSPRIPDNKPKKFWLVWCKEEDEYYSYSQKPGLCPKGHNNLEFFGPLQAFDSSVSPDGSTWDLFVDDDGSNINAKRVR